MNNIDTVQVTYDTIWEHANLTLFCGIDEAENKWALANIPLRMFFCHCFLLQNPSMMINDFNG